MRKPVIIAVDGPSGSGKSTISAGLAQSLGYDYINTGSLYRAVAFKAAANRITFDNEFALSELAKNTVFKITKNGGIWSLIMDNMEVDGELKRANVAQASSIISVFPEVRNVINSTVHKMIKGNTVVEGRDIGTVVFPSADIKFFIVAAPKIRAKRRYDELVKEGADTSYEKMLSEIKLRDARDEQRKTAPLKPAEAAIIVDTTYRSADDTIALMCTEVKARLSRKFIDTVNGIQFYTTISAGFCFGVKRAVDIAIKTSKQHKIIHTLGPLIHNPQEIERLEKMGIKSVEDISDISSGTLIYRSHGVMAEEADNAKKRGLNIIDATCPFVTRSQRLVEGLTKKGFHVVIVGDAKHPEVKSLLSYVLPEQVTVVKSAEELPSLWNIKRLAVLAQTTQSMENFKKVISALVDHVYELVIYNTVCDATKIRQEESAMLAKMVDIIFVIGGFNSSNTNKLANICKAINPKTYHIEHLGQIRREVLIGAKKVGITAGASTPIWLIKDIFKKLKDISRELK